MKIISIGSIPELKPYVATCSYCKTVFEFMKGEATLKSCQRDGSWLTIDCPLCKKSVSKDI